MKQDNKLQPNIFSFATSELSQDAFLCWFLSWANKKYATTDKGLHQCALAFIAMIFKKHSINPPSEIKNIEVVKQYKNIDVLCVINDKYPIIIEDKILTMHHSDQLARYYNEVTHLTDDPQKILPIYYKIGEQSNYDTVEKDKYKPFHRNEMIKILEAYKGNNQILIDYRSHLQNISKRIESYKYLPLDTWTSCEKWKDDKKYNRNPWVGFYLELQSRLKTGNWKYVSNKSGGFMGFWWGSKNTINSRPYLQLEENKLCFKIKVEDKLKRKELRTKWNQTILKNNKLQPHLQLTKPDRFGSGKYMTVCVHKADYRILTKDNKIDMDSTVQLLQSAQRLLISSNSNIN